MMCALHADNKVRIYRVVNNVCIVMVNGEVKIAMCAQLSWSRSLRWSSMSFKEEDEDEIGCYTYFDREKGRSRSVKGQEHGFGRGERLSQ